MNEDRRRAAHQTLGARWPIFTLYGGWIIAAAVLAVLGLLAWAYLPRLEAPDVPVPEAPAVEAPSLPGAGPVLAGIALVALVVFLVRAMTPTARMRRRIRRGR